MSSGRYGLMAEFSTPGALIEAARAAREAGYGRVEAYAPFHVEGLAEAVGFTSSKVPLATLLGSIAGGVFGYLLQWYSAVIDYPLDIGGRPVHAWPMFIPVTFSLTVLGGALAAVGMAIFGSRLPKLYHPVFNVPDFELASQDRFFLCLRDEGAGFDADGAARWLAGLQPVRVAEVPL